MTEHETAEQLGAILRQLEDSDEHTGELADAVAAMQTTSHEIVRSLDALRSRLPEGEEPLPRIFVPRSRFRAAVAGLALASVLVASLAGLTLFLTHQTTCGARGVIILARTNIERTPVPTDPERIERRTQSLAFYAEALPKLKILWPCAGETANRAESLPE